MTILFQLFRPIKDAREQNTLNCEKFGSPMQVADPASLISIDPAIVDISTVKGSLTQQLKKLIVDNPALAGIFSDLFSEQRQIDATTTRNTLILNEQLRNLICSMKAIMIFSFLTHNRTKLSN